MKKARSRLQKAHNLNKRLVKGINGYYFANDPKKTTRDYIIVNAFIFVCCFFFYSIGLLQEPRRVEPLISPYIASYTSEQSVSFEVTETFEEVLPTAKVTAYSCGGLKTEAEINMNCPSLWNYPEGRTADGTAPVPYKTVACDRANLGKKFWLDIDGGLEVKCTDTGGAILGKGRFDLYLPTVQDARQFGVQHVEYKEL